MEPIKIIAQLNSVRTTNDGGGRLVLEFGRDSLEGILELQRLNASNQISLAIAIIPYDVDNQPLK